MRFSNKVKIFLLLAGVAFSLPAWAQKKLIDHSSYRTWPKISEEKISGDGNYICYHISTPAGGSDLIIQSISGDWNKTVHAAENAQFTEDSRKLIYKTEESTLGVIELLADKPTFTKPVVSFKMPSDGTGEWLSYVLSDTKELVLLNLFTGVEKTYPSVTNYVFNDQGSALVMQSDGAPHDQAPSIIWHSLKDGKDLIIGSGYQAEDFVFDESGSKLAFITKEPVNGVVANKLRYYDTRMTSAAIAVDQTTAGMKGMEICTGRFYSTQTLNGDRFTPLPRFSKDGSHLFFSITPTFIGKRDTLKNVIVWSYKDKSLNYSKDRYKIDGKKNIFFASVSLTANETINQIDSTEDESLIVGSKHTNYALVTRKHGSDVYYDPNSCFYDLYLVNTNDGSRRLVTKNLYNDNAAFIALSLTGKYVLWYDVWKRQYFT